MAVSPCRYFLNVPVNFKGVQCRLSIFRNGRVTLSNLRVKDPIYVSPIFHHAFSLCGFNLGDKPNINKMYMQNKRFYLYSILFF